VGVYLWERTHEALKVNAVSVALANPPGTKCNVTVDVVGTIVTNGHGGAITYQWIRNSNDTMAPATVTNASGQDTVQVQLKWAFHGKGTQHAVAELHVLSPNAAVGNTEFTYSCA
jgi:hypothetical protein